MALMHRYTGQDDVLVGTPISGRTRSETENLIGMFLNSVVLRATFTKDLNFRSLLKQVSKRLWRPIVIRTFHSNNSSLNWLRNERPVIPLYFSDVYSEQC